MNTEVYNSTMKVRYQKTPQSLFHLDWSHNIRKWMRHYFPGHTASQHKALRDEAKSLMEGVNREYAAIRDPEFQRIFKRPFQQVSDHRVTGICRSEFSEPVKNKLRQLTDEAEAYWSIAYAHNIMLPAKVRGTWPSGSK